MDRVHGVMDRRREQEAHEPSGSPVLNDVGLGGRGRQGGVGGRLTEAQAVAERLCDSYGRLTSHRR
jgi:hypothetical protein